MLIHHQREVVLDSLRDFMSPDAIDRTLLSEDQFFNWRTLQRALEHARAWQPGAFRLFERLQNDFLQEHLKSCFRHGGWISHSIQHVTMGQAAFYRTQQSDV